MIQHAANLSNPTTRPGFLSGRPILWLIGCLALLGGLGLRAQEALGPFISTLGTTVREPGTGRDWAYLLWTANSPALLNGRTHAIYSKPGNASAPGIFTRLAIVSLQTEAITLAPLLGRAALLGEQTNTLSSDIDALFGKFVPQNLSVPEKLSAVVRGALQDEKYYGRLILLSRAHPSVAMALGCGHAELIPPGDTTFEVREFDRTTQTDGAVIGRVTVVAGAPTVLPAPGAPVELVHNNSRGHLNAQLRWGVPDALRRLSLLQHGYNVWRVREDFAEGQNWDLTPPTPDALVASSFTTNAVRRVNRQPLLISKTFSVAAAADFSPTGDTNTFFLADDNDRGRSNVVTSLDFTNGARFYYFVTARDVLGRDGLVSTGREVQICNKLPPDAVAQVEVVNDSTWQGGTNRQRLRVNWPQAANLPLAEQRIKSYWIYRWSSLAEMRAEQANPLSKRIAVVNHVPGQPANTYLDNGPGAPTPQTDEGKTFWYTVRAEDDGACQGNLAPHSAPAFGVLRDRTGPVEPTGSVRSVCYDPAVNYLTRVTNGSPGAVTLGAFQFTLTAVRGDRLLEWVEFEADVRPAGATNVVATYRSSRMYFSSGLSGSLQSFPFTVPVSWSGHTMTVRVQAGFATGEAAQASAGQPLAASLATGDQRVVFLFGADLKPQAKDVPCDQHFSVGPSETLQPIEVIVQPKAGSKEVRVYRRVDDGPLDLIYQRPLTNLNELTIPDDALPQGGGRICYFACTLDEHGNASALTALGCKFSLESSPPPRPQLAPITSQGSEEAAQMVLSWFCPSVNVDRFEVGIAAIGDVISTNCAPGYLLFIPPPDNLPELQPVSPLLIQEVGLPLDQLALNFRRFLTPKPGAGFGSADRFSFAVDIQPGRRYVVYVKSIGKSGNRSAGSNLESFYWEVPGPQFPEVPWPARPLPPVGNSFGLNFDARFMPACGTTNPAGPVVRISAQGYTIGIAPCPESLASGVYPGTNPNSLLPTNSVGESLFPVALYRQQVANTAFPVVSGDVVQVSPLMESIAWGTNAGTSYILDPYVLLERNATVGVGTSGMYLRDTQPIISGSRYRYFLARFNHLGELAEVIPAANELEAP